jgi:hypothetical protein
MVDGVCEPFRTRVRFPPPPLFPLVFKWFRSKRVVRDFALRFDSDSLRQFAQRFANDF